MPGCTQPPNHDQPVEPGHARPHTASKPRPTGRAGPCPAALRSPSQKTAGACSQPGPGHMPGCTQPSNHDQPVEPGHARLLFAPPPKKRPAGDCSQPGPGQLSGHGAGGMPGPSGAMEGAREPPWVKAHCLRGTASHATERTAASGRAGPRSGIHGVSRHPTRTVPTARQGNVAFCIPPAPCQPHASETLLPVYTQTCDPMSQPKQPSRRIRQHPAHRPRRTMSACLSEYRDDR